MSSTKAFIKKLNQRFSKKQDEIYRLPGILGDGSGNLYPSGLSGFVYVTLGDKALPVYNNRVPAQYGVKVWVGYAPEEPTLFQVLSTRSESPSGSNFSGTGYAPAKRYEWMAQGGGQDPLHVHLRALTLLKTGLSSQGGMYVELFKGYVWNAEQYLTVSTQDLDLTAHIPSTASKAALVLISIDESGSVIQTKGAEVDIDALALSDLPPVPSGTVFVSSAVRVYNGQTVIREGRVNTDIVDLRFGHLNTLLARIGTPTYYTLQHMQNLVHSAGWLTGGEITDNGDGTIDVAAGSGLIRATDSDVAELLFTDWALAESVSLTDDSDNWIYVEYNSGSPQVGVATSEPTDLNTNVLLARVYRSGTDLHINEGHKHTVGNHAGLMMQAMAETMPFAHVSGGYISETGTAQFAVSAGVWWWGLNRFTTAAFNGAADLFNLYYRDGVGGWTEDADQSSLNNSDWDDGTGTLNTLTANRYGVHWIFLSVEGDLHDVIGQGDYTLADAQVAQPPSSLPPEIVADSRLIGKIILQEGETTAESVESVFNVPFVAGGGTGAVDSVNGYTGTVVLDPDDLDDSATINKFTTAGEITKLSGIETAADVTDIVNVGAALNGAASDTPLDADKFSFWDVVDGILKNVTWANIKATLKTYFDTLYPTNDGWIPITAEWVRTGNHTFTVSGDVTSDPNYAPGMKVQYYDGAVDYGTILSRSYSSPNTTITLITNTNYLMANVIPITGRYVSKVEKPDGFPSKFNYTPTPTTPASIMTFSSLTYPDCFFKVIGGMVYFAHRVLFTLGGTAETQIYISAPTPINLSGNGAFVSTVFDAPYLGRGVLSVSNAQLIHWKGDATNYSLGTGKGVVGEGFYPL